MTRDCLVVGGGLIGMLTARELALAGLRVTVVERGGTGQESSWAGGGILSPLYPWRYPDAVTWLASWGQARYRELCDALRAESGVDPEWTPSGMLVLAPGDGDAAGAWAARHGVALHEEAGADARRREPALGALPERAIWMPDVAQVRNPRLVQALRGSLDHLGVEVLENCAVTGLVLQGGQIQGVATGRGRLAAGTVVVAGGAWSAGLLADAVSLDVVPVRGQMLLFRTAPGTLRRILLREGHYVIPRRDGLVLAGSTLEYVGYDKSVTGDARAELWDAAVRLVPALADCPVERHWAGLRPGSPAGVPFIGKAHKFSGLYFNAGHFRNGVVLGPASARLVADLILERAPIVDPTPYALPPNP